MAGIAIIHRQTKKFRIFCLKKIFVPPPPVYNYALIRNNQNKIDKTRLT